MSFSGRIEGWLWHPRWSALPGLPRLALVLVRYAYALLRDVIAGPLTLHAMGLVYVTLLSVVPLLAVSFSVVKAFGFHHQLEPLLFGFLEPLGARGAELTARVIGFVDNAQGSVLAGVGLLFLFITALSMAGQMEVSFNRIWRVEQPRSLGRRVTEYLSVILVGPVVMVTAMAIIAGLRSNALLQALGGSPLGAILGMPATILPYALVCVGFSLVYWFVPNTRVRPGAALAGGLLGGVLWVGTGVLFASFVVNAAATISIYATFAIVISALFWLYLSWLILLVGAQFAFYVQRPDYLRVGFRRAVTGTGQMEAAALAVMLLVARAFRAGAAPLRPADIAAQTGLPGLALAPVIARLEAAGLLSRTAGEALLPQRELAGILLHEIMQAVRHPTAADIGGEIRWPAAVADLTARLDSTLANALRGRSLADLADEIPRSSS
ncbi:MAG: YihY family inner membrane protein [Gammaproteobacteria bacterium]|nr:YihY family inner membrane protein [Gammaproteobacteria bacterium]QOJ30693.1 MAG: YihY family inner membrane protein [Gammaproteobacteria bacterium]